MVFRVGTTGDAEAGKIPLAGASHSGWNLRMRGYLFFWLMEGVCLVTLLAALSFWIAGARKRSRPPLAFKLLRGPGEALRRRINKLDENLWMVFLGATLGPMVITCAVISWLSGIWSQHLGLVLIIAGIVFVVSLAISSWIVIKEMSKRRNLLLGYLGERAVAEYLGHLQSEGFKVFHDVPAEGASKKFNIDHVVVGPTGLFAVETKTRRKGRARPGYTDHQVLFDGQQLVWPWGEDRHGLEQAVNEAKWLSQWLESMTGIKAVARPILALPGWFVTNQARGAVSVLNEKNLCSAILGRGEKILTPEQIDLLARQLENRCRDVED